MLKKEVDNYNNLNNNKEPRQRLRVGFLEEGSNIIVLGRVTCQILLCFYYILLTLTFTN